MMSQRFDLSVYLVTDTALCGPRGMVETVRAAIAGGATLVQLRDPDAHGRALVELARALLALLRPRGIPLLVNDRVDVALAAGADGVHVGQSDMAPADVRRLIGPDLILGLSVGTPAEFASSDLAGVDYLGVGPVFATGTKSDAGAAIGIDGIAAIRARTHLPIVAIGGIDVSRAVACLAAGADGVAVVSAICAAPDPKAATAKLVAAITAARNARA